MPLLDPIIFTSRYLAVLIAGIILVSWSGKAYAQAPTISYTPSTYVFTAGTAISPLTPTLGGGPADSYTSDPLPAGLSIDPATGIISGTPTAVTATNTYTVTAVSALNGNGTTTITLTVNPALPIISYTTPNTFTYGTAITTLTPNSTGGAVASYAISPALPAGLSFDTSSGAISGTPTAATAAADYTVTATNVTGNGTATVNITVNKATLTATADNQSKVYGAANPTLTITYSGFANGDTQAVINTLPTATTTATTASGVNTYPITPAGGSDNNYTFSYVAGTLTVTQATLTATADNQTKVYGTANPTLTITYSGFVNGDTQAVINTLPTATTTATTASGVNTYPITPAGGSDNNYTFSYVAGTLTVTQATLTATADNQTKVYGTANPTLTITYSGFVNGDTQAVINTLPTATTTATTASGVNTYPITPAGGSDNNYTFSYVAGTLTVTQATLTATADNQSKVYGAANPTLTITYSGFVNGDTQAVINTLPTATTTATTASGVNTYPITPAGGSDNNYTFSYVAGTLTVTQATLTATADNQSKVYGAANPTLTITYSGFVNGDTQAVINTLPTATTTATTASGVNTYPITPAGGSDNNYTFSYVAGTLTVTQATLTATADNQTKVYGAANPTLTITYSGFVNGDTQAVINTLPTASTTATTNSPVNTYPITPAGGSDNNYTFSYVAGTLTITQANLTITATGPAKTYGQALTAGASSSNWTASGTVPGENVTSVTLTPDASGLSATTAAGSGYTVTPSAPTGTGGFLASNYNITFNTFNGTVLQAALTVTATGPTKTYGTALTAGPTASNWTATGAIAGENVTSVTLTPDASGLSATTAAGSAYTVTPSAPTGTGGFLASNYAITFNNYIGTVAQAALTVTATGPAKTYGTALIAGPTGTNWTATGAIAGENVTSVTLTPNAAGLSATTAAGSAYSVTPSAPTGTGGFLASNYNITFNTYNGTVAQAALTITATGPTKTYGTALTAGPTGANWTAAGTVAGENVTSVTLTPNAAGLSATTAAGSAYSVTPSAPTGTGGFLASNYNITFNTYNGTVAQANLTITATGPTKTYGTALTAGPTGTNWTATGAIAGQNVTSVTLTPNAAGLSATTAAGSAYSVTPSAPTGTGGFLASNYNITFNTYNGTVAQANLTITATGPTKTYGTALTAGPTGANWTAFGAIAGQNVTSVTLTPNAAGLSATTAAGSAYSVTPSAPTGTGGFLASNYNITFNNYNGTVAQANLTITATGPTKTYGTALTAGPTGANWTAAGTIAGENVTSVTLTPNAAGLSATTAAGSAYSVTPSAPTGTGGFLASNYNITFNNYNGTVAQAALTITATGPTKTYGTALTAGPTGTNWTATGAIAGQNVTSVTLTPNAAGLSATTAAGSAYSVTPSAPTGTGGFLASNYNITFNTYNGTVAQANLTITATGPTKTYGTALTAGPTGTNWTATGAIAGQNVTSVTLTPNAAGLSATTAAGSAYTVTPSAPTGTGGFLASNYNITFNTYNGTVAQANLTITATGPTKTYGTALTAGPTGANWTAFGAIAGQNVTSVTLTPNAAGLSATTAAGSAYSVTPSAPSGTGGFLASNYNITFNNYNGTVAQANLTITATGPTKTYGTALTAGPTGANWTAAGTIAGENVTSVTLTPNAAGLSATTAAGSAYSVTPSAPTGTGGFLASNYNITFNNYNGTVAQAALTITATGPTKTYGTALTAGPTGTNWTATGAIAGQNVTSVTLTPNAAGLSATTAAGSAYSVTPSAPTGTGGFLASNYNITFNTYNGTVAQANLTITATGPTKTYGTALTAGPTGTNWTATGAIAGQNVTSVTLTPNAAGLSATTAAGSAYTVTPSAPTGTGGFLASNYNITFNTYNGTVAKATLTVTANNQTKVYGAANPTLTATYTGFVNGETIAVVTTLATISTTATTASNAGTYPITAAGAAATNYTFNYVAGTLTVTQAVLTATANNQTKIQGAANPTLTITYTGFVNGDTQAVINTLPTATTTATTGSPVGTYPITPAGGSDNNYTFNYVNGTLTINPQLPAFTYSTPVSISVGTTVSLSPTNTGGPVTSYAVSPTLPAGLTLNTTTGVISGTPTTVTSGASYTVTGTNVTGNGTFAINITITATGSNAFDWTGAVSTAWNNPLNWEVNGIQQTTIYPGSASTTDVANIGVNTAIATFTNYPVLSTSNITIASLTFGNNNAALNNNAGGVINFTVNGFTLTVTGTITQNHSATGGNSTNDVGVTTTLLGNGSITCAALTVGNTTTLPANALEVCTTKFLIGGTTASTLNVTVTGNLTINSASTPGNTLIINNSDAYVSLGAGTLTVGGTITIVTGTPGDFYFIGQYAPSAKFSIDLNNTNTPVLNLSGPSALNIGTNAANNTNNKVDFYNPVATPHNVGTVNYTGASQEVYNYNTSTTTNSLIDNNGEANGDGYVYQNISFSGSGTKTLDAGTFKVNGTFTIVPGTETVSLSTNNPTLTVAGNFSTGSGATFTNGTSTITIGGGFNNSGTTTFGTPLVTFNSTTAATFTAPSPVTFTNVAFSGGGAKNMTSGTFDLNTTGILTMSGNTALAAGGYLTLLSNASSTATIAAVPTGCSITGNVNVQRYLTGARGYRLIASPVYAATVGSNNVYSLNYVKNSAYITGTGGIPAGFDKLSQGPTLYLYREDAPVSNATFISGNYQSINNLTAGTNTPPTYTFDYTTTTGSYSIPVSNAFLFFFRGNRADGTLAQETVTTWPATTATLSTTGTLNTGQVVFRDWYNAGSNFLGYSNPNIAAQGFNLAANPYASSIDLDTYNTTTTTTGIYTQNLSKFIYELNPNTGNYDTYKAGSATAGLIVNTNHGGRTIVSGQGFFVLALSAGNAQLIFNESAKVNTQVPVNTGNNTNPALMMAAQFAADQHLRLQLAKDSINTDDILIQFDPASKNTFDLNEDAPYRIGGGKVSLMSFSADHIGLAVNQLPFIVQGQKIPLNVSASSDGTYSLNMTELKGIPQLFNVWLKDNYLKDSVNMISGNTYSFSIQHSDTSTFGANRFAIVINQNPAYAYRLLNFNASKDPGMRAVQVAWQTQYEDNYTQFFVERSIDNGQSYMTLGSVPAVGSGNYGLLDPRPIVGQNLYRLRQIDINNNVTYSKVVLVSYSDLSNSLAKNNISVFPNPTSGNVTLAVLTDNNSGQTYNVSITNNTGYVVKQTTTNQPNLQLNLSGWLPGTYLVRVLNSRDQTEVGTTKLIKL